MVLSTVRVPRHCDSHVKVKVNFVIYIADWKATTYIYAMIYLLCCVNSAALPQVLCYSFHLPWRVASWVNYSRQCNELNRPVSTTEVITACWRLMHRCSDLKPWPTDPKASVLPTTPQCPTHIAQSECCETIIVPCCSLSLWKCRGTVKVPCHCAEVLSLWSFMPESYPSFQPFVSSSLK